MCLILDVLECLEFGDWVFSFGIFGIFGFFGIFGSFWNLEMACLVLDVLQL